jgi:hypothetical protein
MPVCMHAIGLIYSFPMGCNNYMHVMGCIECALEVGCIDCACLSR